MLWIVQPNLDGLETYFALAEQKPNFSLIRNKDELHVSRTSSGTSDVVPVLEIPDASFGLDFFSDGGIFVSRRLVDALALPAGVASFVEADTARCPEEVRALGYRLMTIEIEGDAVDPQRSDGGMVDVLTDDGDIVSRWEMRLPQPNTPAPRVTWREDYLPPADLFRIVGTGWNGVTDELAARVLAAGLTGLNFVDVVATAATGEMVVKGR